MEYTIWNNQTAMFRERNLITSDQVSETIPNETLSMQELVDRFVKGHNIPGLKNYPFDSDQPDEEELPDIGMMSKTEVAQLKLEVTEKIQVNEQELIETRKKIAVQNQQIKDANAALKLKKVTTQAPKETKTE